MIMLIISTDRPSVKTAVKRPTEWLSRYLAYCTVVAAVPQNGEPGLSKSIQQDKRK
jgi:hypothetical protein